MPQRRHVLVLVVLTGICLGVYVRAWRPGSHASSSVPAGIPVHEAEPPAAPASSSPSAEFAQARAAQEQRAELLTWGRDPFLTGQNQADGELTLSGILWDAERPLAIINGAPVGVGDRIEGFHVQDIQPEHVTLTDGTVTYDLQIAP